MSKEETMGILEKFFGECLRYWERTLHVDSDLDRAAYEHANEDIPKHDPYSVSGELLNPEWVEEFRKYRLMDCYGHGWESHVKGGRA